MCNDKMFVLRPLRCVLFVFYSFTGASLTWFRYFCTCWLKEQAFLGTCARPAGIFARTCFGSNNGGWSSSSRFWWDMRFWDTIKTSQIFIRLAQRFIHFAGQPSSEASPTLVSSNKISSRQIVWPPNTKYPRVILHTYCTAHPWNHACPWSQPNSECVIHVILHQKSKNPVPKVGFHGDSHAGLCCDTVHPVSINQLRLLKLLDTGDQTHQTRNFCSRPGPKGKYQLRGRRDTCEQGIPPLPGWKCGRSWPWSWP